MQAPKIPSFFKAKKPNQFEYQPRYYSERKEKMDERYKRIQRELDAEKGKTSDTENREEFKSNLRHSWEAGRRTRTKKLNIRIVFYVLFLLAVAYYLLR